MLGQFGNTNEYTDSSCARAAGKLPIPPAVDALQSGESVPSSDKQLRALAAFAPIGIFQGNVVDGCLYANEAWQEISGQTLKETVGSGWLQCVHAADSPALIDCWSESVSTGQKFEFDYRLVRKSGEIRHVRLRANLIPSGDAQNIDFVGCAEDITNQKEFEARLAAAAMTDQLTGLPNRECVLDQVRQALTDRRAQETEFALMFLDFDHFKSVNDSWGHDVGDQLLRQIADRIREELREIKATLDRPIESTASRFGGDEFVLLFNGVDGVADSQIIAQRLHAKLAKPYQLGPYRTFNSASIGIVVGPADYQRAEDVLRDADTAMYEAKRAGRDRYEFFDTEMHTQVRRRLQIKNELQTVIEANKLSLNYQPIVSLQTGEISGVEALVRWNHHELGWISPAEFIPIAQETDLILELGEWVLREGCRQSAEWKSTLGRMAPPQISINLARKQFGDPRMLEVITEVLNENGLQPHELQLEVTEDAFALDVEDAVDTMRSIRELGVKLAIDDFGSGTSSFIALHRFPVDVLKIDRSLIKEIEESSGEAAMLHGLAVMARNLDIKLVAEGIETSNQARAVQDLGCEYMQGYFFARPMSADDVADFMIEEERLNWCEVGAVSFARAWSQRLAYHVEPEAVANPIR
jgi:diguanylate cyclase (GGDEF)-like protein/PAS domain S-box-containing protein